MDPLASILTVLLLLISIALIGLILLQRGRGSGMVGFGGGVEQAFGTRATTLAQKVTVVLGILFLLLSIVLGLRYQHGDTASPSRPEPPPQTEGE